MTSLTATVSIGMPTNSLLRQHAQKFGKLGCVHVVADIDGQTDIQTLVTILRSPIGKHVTFAYCAVRTNFRRRQKWCCRATIMSQTFSTSWYSFKNSVRNIDNWES